MRSRFDVGKFLGVLIFGSVLLATPTSAMADSILTLNPELPHTVGPQSESAPCIIAGTNCQNGTFPYTNFDQSGNEPLYDQNSPPYLVSQFPFSQFNVAIDVNTAKEGETLELFEVWLGPVGAQGSTRLYHFDTPTNIATDLPNNGNGFADWTLRSIDLSSFSDTDTIQFRAKWSGSSDGAESFFLVGAGTPTVPEPTSLLLLGTGLSGLALVAWRKRKS